MRRNFLSQPRINSERLSDVATTAIIAAWLLSALRLVSKFGFNYDEVFFVNAATDGLTNPSDSLFVRRRLFGFPVLLMDYIGALKAWLYVPIFAAFDPTVWSVRIPNLVFGATGIWISTRTLRGYGATYLRPALALILASAVTPTLLLTFDFGPVAIAFVLQALMLVVLVRVSRLPNHKRLPSLVIGIVAGFLGVFNKLDFLIFALPYLVMLFYFSMPATIKFIRDKPGPSGVVFGTCALFASAITSYMLLPSRTVTGGGRLPGLAELHGTASQLNDFLAGRAFTQFISFRPEQGPWLAILVSVSMLPAFVRLLARTSHRLSHHTSSGRHDALDASATLTLLLGGSLVILSLTEGAQRPWHLMTIWPLLPVTAALALQDTLVRRRNFGGSEPRDRSRPMDVLIIASLLAGVVSLFFGVRTLEGYQFASDREPISLFWSDRSDELASALVAAADARDTHIVAYTSHWGISKAHFVGKDDVTLIDSWPWFSGDDLEVISSKLEWTLSNWVSSDNSPSDVVLIEISAGASESLSPQTTTDQSTQASERVRAWCNSGDEPLLEFGDIVIWELPCLGP